MRRPICGPWNEPSSRRGPKPWMLGRRGGGLERAWSGRGLGGLGFVVVFFCFWLCFFLVLGMGFVKGWDGLG